jgi:AAA+ superfamily predicted ATPase
MALRTAKAFFSENHQGYISPVHILSAPVVPQRDPDISLEDSQNFLDLLASSTKLLSTAVIFYGLSSTRIVHDKASLLASTSLNLKRQVCLLQCAELAGKYIGETEKHLSRLIAEAESNNWILFFDKADALFTGSANIRSPRSSFSDIVGELGAGHLLDIMLRHKGLLILSISEKQLFTTLKNRIKDCVVFR